MRVKKKRRRDILGLSLPVFLGWAEALGKVSNRDFNNSNQGFATFLRYRIHTCLLCKIYRMGHNIPRIEYKRSL